MVSCGHVPKKPSRELYCYHCNQTSAKPTFYRHRSEYYNPIRDVWSKELDLPSIPAGGDAERLDKDTTDEDLQDGARNDTLIEVETQHEVTSPSTQGIVLRATWSSLICQDDD